MAITASDINFRLSGGTTNTDPDVSIGGAMSTEAGGIITSGELNNLFDDVSGDEGADGDTEYRCFYVENDHGSLTWSAIKAWLSALGPSADSEFAIAVATEGKNTAVAAVADEGTAPAGVTWLDETDATPPTTKADGLSLPDLDASDYIGVWVRRTITAGAAAVNSDGPTITVEGDTPA